MERLRIIKEKKVSTQESDLAHKFLDQRFQKLELGNTDIEVFGVDFLKGQMNETPLTSLKFARTLGQEKAHKFSQEVVGVLAPSENSNSFKEKITGIMAYGALEVTKEVIKEDSSLREKKRKLVFLESFVENCGLDGQEALLLIKEGEKEAVREEIIKNLVSGAEFILINVPALIPVAKEALELATKVSVKLGKLGRKIHSVLSRFEITS